ncbi:MAG: hypothetical protein M1827_006664 [Pycnora praestabilis]|nr:MAG: hypothetical protein M1827_006664 [Pycnora praestabilis]
MPFAGGPVMLAMMCTPVVSISLQESMSTRLSSQISLSRSVDAQERGQYRSQLILSSMLPASNLPYLSQEVLTQDFIAIDKFSPLLAEYIARYDTMLNSHSVNHGLIAAGAMIWARLNSLNGFENTEYTGITFNSTSGIEEGLCYFINDQASASIIALKQNEALFFILLLNTVLMLTMTI